MVLSQELRKVSRDIPNFSVFSCEMSRFEMTIHCIISGKSNFQQNLHSQMYNHPSMLPVNYLLRSSHF